MLIPNSTVVDVASLIVVEDHPFMGRILRDGLERIGFNVTLAKDLTEGRKKIASKYKHSDAVLLDGSLGHGELSTPLIELLKQLQYKGHIVAISNNPETNEVLTKAGCTHSCEKKDVLEFITKLFGVN